MIDIAKLEKMMSLMKEYGIDAVQAEEGGERISLSRNGAHIGGFAPQQMYPSSAMTNAAIPSSAAPSTLAPAAPVASSPSKNDAASQKIPEGVTISSPFVGTFYRAPGPDTKNFVDIGSRVKKGQTLCIVEAMKIMNEIESEADGEVVAILAENAKPVEFGTPLFVIKP